MKKKPDLNIDTLLLSLQTLDNLMDKRRNGFRKQHQDVSFSKKDVKKGKKGRSKQPDEDIDYTSPA